MPPIIDRRSSGHTGNSTRHGRTKAQRLAAPPAITHARPRPPHALTAQHLRSRCSTTSTAAKSPTASAPNRLRLSCSKMLLSCSPTMEELEKPLANQFRRNFSPRTIRARFSNPESAAGLARANLRSGAST